MMNGDLFFTFYVQNVLFIQNNRFIQNCRRLFLCSICSKNSSRLISIIVLDFQYFKNKILQCTQKVNQSSDLVLYRKSFSILEVVLFFKIGSIFQNFKIQTAKTNALFARHLSFLMAATGCQAQKNMQPQCCNRHCHHIPQQLLPLCLLPQQQPW